MPTICALSVKRGTTQAQRRTARRLDKYNYRRWTLEPPVALCANAGELVVVYGGPHLFQWVVISRNGMIRLHLTLDKFNQPANGQEV